MTKQLPFGGSAVMAMRHEPVEGVDDFPTPPWATRALFECVLPFLGVECVGFGDGKPARIYLRSVNEPACNRGIMADVIKEYARKVHTSDIVPYGYSPEIEDFLEAPRRKVDWVITNPPFNQALPFALKAIEEATEGVALLCRLQWAEGVDRYDQLFTRYPPTAIAVFAERVPMVQGRWDPDADTMTSYAWFVWRLDADATSGTEMMWIPPGQRRLLARVDDAARFCPAAPAPLLERLG